MAWDAGTIVAELRLEDEQFDRRLREDVAKIENFEKRSHEIKLTPKIDESDTAQARRAFQRLDQQVTNDARSRGGVLGVLHGMFGRGGSTPGRQGGGFFRNIAGAAGPGLNNFLPIGARAGLIGAGAGIGLGALPALAAPLLAGGVGAAGIGVAALGARELIGTKQKPSELYAPAQQALKQLQAMIKSAAQPLVAPLERVFKMLPDLIRQVGPALHSMFAGAATLILPVVHGLTDLARMVLPLLGQAFRAVAPLMRPLIDGIGMLLRGLLPGVIVLLRAARPAIMIIAQVLGTLGKAIGQMLKDFAPVLKQSAVIFKALADVVSALFPIIGRLAAIFARALAPVVKEFSRVIVALTPVLVIIGKLLGDLAGAVLGDLVTVFKAVADLIVGIAPSLAQFAKAFGQVFKVLENSGVFGVIASALESLAKPLGRTIGLLLRGLVPLLPPLVKFLGQLATMLAHGLAEAILALLPPLTQLALVVLKALADALPVVLPLIVQLVGLLTPAVVGVIQGVANALAGIISALPPKVLEGIVLGLLAVWGTFKSVKLVNDAVGQIKKAVGAVKTFASETVIAGAKSAASAVKTAAVWVAQTAKIVAQWAIQAAKATASAVVQAAKWVWAAGVIIATYVARAAAATATFIAENAASLGIIAGIALLVAAIIFLATHWKQTWNVIKTVAKDVWEFLTHGWGQFLIPQLYLIRKVVEFVRDHWRQAWNLMKSAAQDFWHYIWDDFGAKIVGFFTQTLPNAFQTAVRFIGQHWNDIKAVIQAPVKFVVDNVLDGLIRVFDWITSKVGLGKPISEVHPFGLATGGRIPGYGGGDRHMALLEGGEAVISKETTAANAATLAAWGVPGFQRGGRFGDLRQPTGPAFGPFQGLARRIGDVGKITAAIFSGNTTALVNAIGDMLGAHGTGGAVGGLGRILTAIPRELIHEIARHLIGIGGGGVVGWPFPRKSLSQLRRIDEGQDMQYPGTTPVPIRAILPGRVTILGPDPGGFGNAYPGQILDHAIMGFKQIYYGHTYPLAGIGGKHVAAGEMIARTGGTTSGGDAAGLSNWLEMGFWPPSWANGPAMHRLLVSGAGAGRPMNRSGAWTLPGLESLWQSAGGPGGLIGHIAGAIALAESGGNPRARNPSGASGLWQILGQVFPGAIMNPFINARNAVRKYYQAGGFSPWVTYETGAYRNFMDSGGWLMPGGLNGTGRPEAVLNPAQSDAFVRLAEAMHAASRRGDQGSLERKLDRLIRAVERSATATGGAVADALNGVTRSAAYASTYSAGG